MPGKSYRFVVKGRVQGVFFRQSAREQALRLGLVGWVRNRADGAVEGEVGGDDAAALDDFRTWLGSGPPKAQVSDLSWNERAPAHGPAGDGFEIRS